MCIEDRDVPYAMMPQPGAPPQVALATTTAALSVLNMISFTRVLSWHLYTSDAADDLLWVDLGGRRIIKKKKKQTKQQQHNNHILTHHHHTYSHSHSYPSTTTV